VQTPRVRAVLARSAVRSALILLDRLAPSASHIRRHLADGRPDVLVVSPLVFPKSREVEYAKAIDGLPL
jgi:hypothetical protein